jgi:hypothetical protein
VQNVENFHKKRRNKMYSLHQVIRKNLVLAAAMLSLLLLSACIVDHSDGRVDNTRYSAAENFSSRIDVTTQTYFELHGINGTVEIIGSDHFDIVDIWGERKVESDSRADAQASLERLSVEITVRADGIIAETRQPEESHGRNYIVNYQVRVPRACLIFAENINGNTTVEAIDNSVAAGLTNGNLQVKSINGNVSAGLVNGNLHVLEISGSLEGALVNGNIYGKVYIPLHGVCKLNTVNGNVALSIPQTTSADFSARISNGGISLANLTLQNATTTPTSTSGVLGSGEGLIELTSVNGSIVVTGF